MVVANVKVRLYNVYGTTEGTVYQMSQRLLPSVDTPPTCIGLPMPGITVAVVHLPMHDDVDDASLAQFNLPAALELVKSGELGELMVGGVQTARGYHSRPDLTSCSFLPREAVAPPDRAAWPMVRSL